MVFGVFGDGGVAAHISSLKMDAGNMGDHLFKLARVVELRLEYVIVDIFFCLDIFSTDLGSVLPYAISINFEPNRLVLTKSTIDSSRRMN
jgi:hypothetical protein